MAAPRTHIPEGADVPERHADRVVAEMLQHIARWQQARRSRPFLVRKAMSAGNPKAQERLVERLRASGGIAAIDMKLTPGKRGRYMIEIHDWTVWDEARGVEMASGTAIPEKPWLLCCVTGVRGLGDGHTKVDSCYVLHLTHHCLSRLAQRCGARTVDDLIAATKALWGSYRAYRAVKPGTDTPDGTRLTVDLPNRMGKAVAVLRRHEDGGLIVATILDRANGV